MSATCRMGFGSAARLLCAVLTACGVLVSVLTASGYAQQPPARVLTCMFPKGQINSYEAGAFKLSPAAALTFDIGDIDIERQTATLITSSGKGDLRVVRAIDANHFLEVVTEGFLNMTTVYDVGSDVYPAVHSRHLGLLGQPVVSQYVGTCRPRR